MKKKHLLIVATTIIATLFQGCSEAMDSEPMDSTGANEGNSTQVESGKLTAGEWDDLEHWDFWQDLLTKEDFKKMPDYWEWYTNNRIDVKTLKNGAAACNVTVKLINSEEKTIWETRSDNNGMAYLWYSPFQKSDNIDVNKFSIVANNTDTIKNFEIYDEVNEIELTSNIAPTERIEIAFMVDATGSMGDEIAFLQKDLEDVLNKTKVKHNKYELRTAAVFYRDKEDEYLVKKEQFSNNIDNTISYINKQEAFGGGDWEEAVDKAIETSVNELEWSASSRTRILFMLLDAPPHYTHENIVAIHNSIKKAAEIGIRVIPISSSGIDVNTEFLLRDMAITTGGTYVFLTNDSGIGGDHIEPSIGEYQVELLNDLMLRVIDEYIR